MAEVDLRQGEEVWSEVKGDCWNTPNSIGGQVPGKYTFTNQRIIFRGGGLIAKLRMNFEIEIADIDRLKPFSISLFIPTGIKVFLKNKDTYKLSIMKRKMHIAKLEELIGGKVLQ